MDSPLPYRYRDHPMSSEANTLTPPLDVCAVIAGELSLPEAAVRAVVRLMAEGATVTVCHHMTRSVAAHSRRADAVLVAVGKPHFLHGDMVKPGAAVIDIGINHVTGPDGTSHIVGDVDTDSVKEVASWVTPVPGGVGPVTVAMLMRNAMTAHAKQIAAGWLD